MPEADDGPGNGNDVSDKSTLSFYKQRILEAQIIDSSIAVGEDNDEIEDIDLAECHIPDSNTLDEDNLILGDCSEIEMSNLEIYREVLISNNNRNLNVTVVYSVWKIGIYLLKRIHAFMD